MEHTNTKRIGKQLAFRFHWGKGFFWVGIVLGSWSWTVITLEPAWLSLIDSKQAVCCQNCCLVWEWFNYKLVPFVSVNWCWKKETSMDKKVLKLINSLAWPYVSTGAELNRDERAFSLHAGLHGRLWDWQPSRVSSGNVKKLRHV